MKRDSRRWLSLAACLLAGMCAGFGYAWSVLLIPMASEFGWSAAAVSLSFTAIMVAGGIAAIIAGKAQQHVQPRTLLLIGGGVFGAGIIFLGSVNSLGGMYAFAALAGFGMGTVYPGATMSNVIRFFPDKRGLASGLLMAGYGAGAIVWAPICAFLLHQYGLTWALRILGAVFIVIIAAASRMVGTAAEGYRPAGWVAPTPERSSASVVDRDWKAMLRTPEFYVLALLFVAGTLSGMMVIGQASPIAQQILKISPVAASAVVSLLALGMLLGKVACGAASDRIGRYPVFVAMFVVAAGALVVLSGATAYLGVVLSFAAVGFCYGGILALMGPVTADIFGTKYLGVDFGIVFQSMAISAYAGPKLATMVAGANNGDYSTAFMIAACINIAGLALVGCHVLLTRRGARSLSLRQVEDARV